jgi:superfamily II RNA helicase
MTIKQLQWDKPYDMIDTLAQLQKLGENSFNPINLRKNDQVRKMHKNKKAEAIIQKSIENNILFNESEDEKIFDIIRTKLSKTDISISTIINIIKSLKTKKYKRLLLFDIGKQLLEQRVNLDLLFHIFVSLKLDDDSENELEDFNDFVDQCKQILPNIISLQLNQFSEYIYPNDLFNTEVPKLDPWQKELLDNIDKKKNVLLVAPTSAGKTNLAVHVVEVSNKSLFIVPSDAVARQVVGMLLNLKYSVGLITSREQIIQNNNFKVLVGTTIELEDFIVSNPKVVFDYIICDEIHHIGAKENTSSSFERLLKGIDSSILAMSATVGNPNDIKEWLEEIHKKPFIFINHKKRFINQQKHIYCNNEIVPLHPLSTISKDFLLKHGFTSSITFTAKDLFQLYEVTQLDCFSPYIFFNNDIIRNSELLLFEEQCKEIILEKIKANDVGFLDAFNIQNAATNANPLRIIKNLFQKKMYPSLIFTNSYKDCIENYKSIIGSLEEEEEKKYPYYKENNLTRFEHYQEFVKERKKLLEKIEVPKDCTDSHDFINQMQQNIMETFVESLHEKFKTLTYNRIKKIEASIHTKEEKQRLINLCNEDLNKILEVEEMVYVDPYRPHPEFTFTTTITSDKMRKLKNRLSKALETNIDYTHTFLRGLERGIIVYHSQLQTPFQNEIQTLIVQKEVNFIIADESLGAGINMPIKSVVLLGNDFSEWDCNKAQQMCGRSGRRGIDREGHIIYAGKNWKAIVTTPSMNITGADEISTITILPELIYKTPNKSYIINCFKKTLNEFMEKQIIDTKRINKYKINNIKHKKLIWRMRNIDNCLSFDTIFEDLKGVTKTYDLCGIILEKVTKVNEPYIKKCLKENIFCINGDSLLPFKLRLIGIILVILYQYIHENNIEMKYSQPITHAFNCIKMFLLKLDRTF